MAQIVSKESALDLYNFNETLSLLEEISVWLKTLGFPAANRVHRYRCNIQKMLKIEESGGMNALKAASMPVGKVREILWSYTDSDEFVRAITALRKKLGDEITAAPLKRALKGPADLSLENATNSVGRNFMFELIMAGRFAAAGFQPAFDKGPDVQFEFAGLQVAVQCKRPFSKSGLQQNITDAIDQLKKGKADLNLIAVSTSRLLNSGYPKSIPEVLHRDEGRERLQAQICEVAKETERFWRNKLCDAGILFYAFIPIRCHQTPHYFLQRSEALFPLKSAGLTPTLLKCFAHSLKDVRL